MPIINQTTKTVAGLTDVTSSDESTSTNDKAVKDRVKKTIAEKTLTSEELHKETVEKSELDKVKSDDTIIVETKTESDNQDKLQTKLQTYLTTESDAEDQTAGRSKKKLELQQKYEAMPAEAKTSLQNMTDDAQAFVNKFAGKNLFSSEDNLATSNVENHPACAEEYKNLRNKTQKNLENYYQSNWNSKPDESDAPSGGGLFGKDDSEDIFMIVAMALEGVSEQAKDDLYKESQDLKKAQKTQQDLQKQAAAYQKALDDFKNNPANKGKKEMPWPPDAPPSEQKKVPFSTADDDISSINQKAQTSGTDMQSFNLQIQQGMQTYTESQTMVSNLLHMSYSLSQSIIRNISQ